MLPVIVRVRLVERVRLETVERDLWRWMWGLLDVSIDWRGSIIMYRLESDKAVWVLVLEYVITRKFA